MEERYITLIHKKLAGELSEQEALSFEQWLKESPENKSLFESFEKAWKDSKETSFVSNAQVETAWASFQTRINKETKEIPKTTTKKIFPFWKLAAAVLFLCCAGFGIFFVLSNTQKNERTAEGEQKEIKLADGSLVWLNENSTLKHPKKFKKERSVSLEGEAFFDVMEDPEKVFSIQTPESKIKVLGTSFNVRAYPSEEAEIVSVESGTVRFSPSGTQEGLELTKSMTGTFVKKEQNLIQKKDDLLNQLSWKTGELKFKNHNMGDVIDILEEEFKVIIDVNNKDIYLCKFSSVLRTDNLDEILKTLGEVFSMKLEKISSTHYTFKEGTCN